MLLILLLVKPKLNFRKDVIFKCLYCTILRFNLIYILADPNEWLCCDQLTIADISLALLLHRLNCLGMEEHFWKNKRPAIEEYFQRVSQRDAFQKSLPSTYSTVKTVWSKTPSSYKYSAAALSAAVVAGILAQKL